MAGLYQTTTSELGPAAKEAAAALIAVCRKTQAAEVRIEFSGSGDEGGVHSVYFFQRPVGEDWSSYDTAPVLQLPADLEGQVIDAAEEFNDWQDVGYDNEGGGGTIVVNVPAGTFTFYHYWNVEEVQTADEFTVGADLQTTRTDLVEDAFAVRAEAERIIGEDRVPTDTLRELVRTFGDKPDQEEA